MAHTSRIIKWVCECLVQVWLRTEVLCIPSSIRPGFELMTSSSWQDISCHWDACSNHLAISDYPYVPTQTPWGRMSGHLRSPGWQPTLQVPWCQIWWFAIIEKSMVLHETICPYWDQVSLKLHRTNSNSWRLNGFEHQGRKGFVYAPMGLNLSQGQSHGTYSVWVWCQQNVSQVYYIPMQWGKVIMAHSIILLQNKLLFCMKTVSMFSLLIYSICSGFMITLCIFTTLNWESVHKIVHGTEKVVRI